MHRLDIGVKIPEIYVCENRKEAEDAKHYGLPYVIRPRGMTDEKITIVLLYRTLQRKFPHIKWTSVFGGVERWIDTVIINVPGDENAQAHTSPTGDSNIADIAEDDRIFHGGFDEGETDYCERKLYDYIGDMSAEVSIEELQALNLLPSFLSDIADSIKRNLYGYDWTEGYNKKLGVPLGNFNATRERKNLMILDISGSIPRGVSATMLTLIDTLRTQANADLIITGSISMWFEAGSELPDPQWIRNNCGYGNEAVQFLKIMKEHVLGQEFGNVICFGDDDAPEYFAGYEGIQFNIDPSATKVGKLWSYHTCREKTPGYAKWVKKIGVEVEEEVNTKWCKLMHR